MTHRFSLNTWLRLASSLLLAGVAYAAPTTISNSPLVAANPDQAKANLLFVPDDSGSMGLDFLPDHINGDGSPDPALCRSGGANASNSGNFSNPAVMAATTRMRAGQVARLSVCEPTRLSPRSRLQWHGLQPGRALHATSEVGTGPLGPNRTRPTRPTGNRSRTTPTTSRTLAASTC